jgi:4-hydroxythreonine-4-phosphate dehydrogenase
MIYLKSKKDGLNFTLGLPIIRLSPLYGAALDIAGKNRANVSGFVTAIKEGIKISKYARRYEKQ